VPRIRISLRAFLLLIVLTGAILGLLGSELKESLRQQQVGREIAAQGGRVVFDSPSLISSVPLLRGNLMDRITAVDLSGMRLSDGECHALAGLSSLRSLNLSATDITDATLEAICPTSSLESIDLSATRVSDAGCRLLSGCRNLKHVALNNTKITDDGVRALAQLPHLSSLHIGVDPPLMLSSSVTLKPHVTDQGIKQLRGKSSLVDLDVSGNLVTDGAIEDVITLPTVFRT
jgi:Leucine-rich repeat (LRR) protein